MDRSESVALVDFDNTLFFTDECTRRASKELFGIPMGKRAIRKLDARSKHALYVLAQSTYKGYSKPNRFLIDWLTAREGLVVIMTARGVVMRKHTLSLLRKEHVEFDKLVLRNDGAMHMKDEEWKFRKIRELMKAYENVGYYEDKFENMQYIGKRIPDSGKLRLFLVKPNRIIQLR